MSYRAYILFSPSKERFYTGISDNLNRRLSQHNQGKTLSTKYGIPWILVWNSSPLTKKEALALEKKIKSRGAARFMKAQNSH